MSSNQERSPEKDVTPAGWVFPTSTARKCHYFPEGGHRSLCGKYGRFKSDHGQPDTGTASRDDCFTCRRKLDVAHSLPPGDDHA